MCAFGQDERQWLRLEKRDRPGYDQSTVKDEWVTTMLARIDLNTGFGSWQGQASTHIAAALFSVKLLCNVCSLGGWGNCMLGRAGQLCGRAVGAQAPQVADRGDKYVTNSRGIWLTMGRRCDFERRWMAVWVGS